jgi:hypothetical protein
MPPPTVHAAQLLLLAVLLLGPAPIAYAAARSAVPSSPLSHRLLVLLTTWCLVQVGVALVLGSFALLTAAAVTAAELLVCAAGLALLLKLPAGTGPRTRDGWWPRLTPQEGLLLTGLAALGLTLLWTTASTPVSDFDSLNFYLATVAHWHQRQHFAILEQFAGMPPTPERWWPLVQGGRYPHSWEALCALFVMPFRGDFLVALPNLLAWSLLGLAAYRLGATLGVSRLHGLATILLLLSLPLVTENVNTMHVDLALAAFFLAGMYLASHFAETRDGLSLALLLGTLGLLVGIKMSALFYAAAVVAFALASVALRLLHTPPRPGQGPLASLAALAGGRRDAVLVALGLAGGAFLGAYWYWRNFQDLGNPLGLIAVAAGPFTLIPGQIDFSAARRTTLAALFDFTSPTDWRWLLGEAWLRLHVPFSILLLQLGAVTFGSRRLPARARQQALLLGVLLVATVALYWTTPYSGDNGANDWRISPWIGQAMRYALPAVGVFGALAAAGASLWGSGRALMALVLGTAAGTALVSFGWGALPGTALAGAGLLLARRAQWARGARGHQRGLGAAAGAAVVLTLLAAGGSLVARQVRADARAEAYGPIDRCIAEHVGAGDTVGIVWVSRSYLLFGETLDTPVVFVPALRDDLAGWLARLRERGVSVVAVGPLQGEGEGDHVREQAWLEAPGGAFVRLCGEDPREELVLYRVSATPGA